MRCACAVVGAVAVLLSAGAADAQSCPGGELLCSAGWCCPPGEGGRTDVCCDSNPQSEGCTSNGSCGSSTSSTSTSGTTGTTGGGGNCSGGELSCSAGWCCPPGNGGRTDVCCNSNPQSLGCTSDGNCGSGGSSTTTSGSTSGTTSGGTTGGSICPSGTPLHCNAGWCCPYGSGGRTDVCCDDNPQSSGCTANGSCSGGGSPTGGSTTSTSGTSGSGGTTGVVHNVCSSGQIGTKANCGGDTCGCADACTSNTDCRSGCCDNGYCSPPCVCQAGGHWTTCTAKSSSSGCSMAGAGSANGWWIALLLCAGLLLRRRRALLPLIFWIGCGNNLPEPASQGMKSRVVPSRPASQAVSRAAEPYQAAQQPSAVRVGVVSPALIEGASPGASRPGALSPGVDPAPIEKSAR